MLKIPRIKTYRKVQKPTRRKASKPKYQRDRIAIRHICHIPGGIMEVGFHEGKRGKTLTFSNPSRAPLLCLVYFLVESSSANDWWDEMSNEWACSTCTFIVSRKQVEEVFAQKLLFRKSASITNTQPIKVSLKNIGIKTTTHPKGELFYEIALDALGSEELENRIKEKLSDKD